jgi:heparan-alpha-glucosaminide N-acetyltransferase
MVIPVPLWALLMFICVLLIWSHYPKSIPPRLALGAKAVGVLGLVILWWLYKGPDGTGMTVQWWGILGLIGWAYLIASAIYIVSCRCPTPVLQLSVLITAAMALLFIFMGLNAIKGQDIPVLQTLAEVNGNHTHAAIVLAGVVLSLLFYHPGLRSFGQQHYFIFTSLVGLFAFISWEFSPISKIWATPSWALFSVLFCCLIFGVIYCLVDVFKKEAWCQLFEPAATNPLLVYILPYILIYSLGIFGVSLRPDFFNAGVPGIIWCLVFASVIMLIGAGLNRAGLKLKL